MAERSAITQVTQVGVEAPGTPGTAVAATRKLQSMSIQLNPKANSDVWTPKGYKYATLVAPTKEWMEASIDGRMTYDELIYLLSSVVDTGTHAQIMDGGTPTGAYTWVFQSSTNAADVPKTLTVENGSDFRAHRAAYALIKELSLHLTQETCELSGSAIAQRIEDGVTLSPGATEVAGGAKVIGPRQVDIFLNVSAAGIGTTKITRVEECEFHLSDRFGAGWFFDSTKPSWTTHVETDPGADFSLTMEADATGMGMLTALRAGDTRYVRIQAVGPNIYTGGVTVNHQLRLDMAVKVREPGDFGEADGITTLPWTFEVVHDATLGYAFRFELINRLSGL